MAAVERPRRIALLGIPRGVVLAIGWLAAVPWIVSAGRAGLWGGELVDGLVFVLAFWVTFPAWLMLIAGKRVNRPLAATAVYAAVDALPFVLLGLVAVTRGLFTTDFLRYLAIAWVATTTAGVVFGWLAIEMWTRLRRWGHSGVVGRVWEVEDHSWLAASLQAIAIAALAAPVLFALANSILQGEALVAMIVAGTLLSWVVAVCDVDKRVLAVEVVVDVPVMIASTGLRDPSALVVLVLGVAAPVALAAVVSRRSLPETGGAPAGAVAAA